MIRPRRRVLATRRKPSAPERRAARYRSNGAFDSTRPGDRQMPFQPGVARRLAARAAFAALGPPPRPREPAATRVPPNTTTVCATWCFLAAATPPSDRSQLQSHAPRIVLGQKIDVAVRLPVTGVAYDGLHRPGRLRRRPSTGFGWCHGKADRRSIGCGGAGAWRHRARLDAASRRRPGVAMRHDAGELHGLPPRAR